METHSNGLLKQVSNKGTIYWYKHREHNVVLFAVWEGISSRKINTNSICSTAPSKHVYGRQAFFTMLMQHVIKVYEPHSVSEFEPPKRNVNWKHFTSLYFRRSKYWSYMNDTLEWSGYILYSGNLAEENLEMLHIKLLKTESAASLMRRSSVAKHSTNVPSAS
jgi:hypothetical protein